MHRPLTLADLRRTREYRAGGWPVTIAASDERIAGVYPTGEKGWFVPSFHHAKRLAQSRARLYGEPFSIAEIDTCWFVFEPSFARIDVDGEPDRWVARVAFPAIAADDRFELTVAIRAWVEALADTAADADRDARADQDAGTDAGATHRRAQGGHPSLF